MDESLLLRLATSIALDGSTATILVGLNEFNLLSYNNAGLNDISPIHNQRWSLILLIHKTFH